MSLSVLIPVGAATDTDPWRGRALAWLLARYRALLPDAEVVLGHSDPFQRSAARNHAYACSSGDTLLVADADTIFHVDQITAGLALLDRGAPWVIPYRLHEGYLNLTPEATEAVLESPPTVVVVDPGPAGCELRLTSWAGLLLVPRDAWAEAGGYPTALRGWSYEDNCFARALDVMVGPHQRTDDVVFHLWHPRGLEFDGPDVEHNRAIWDRYQQARTPAQMRTMIVEYA